MPYLDRHVRAALERHVAEELLSHLAMDPEPRPDEIARRSIGARAVLEQRVGGAAELARAAELEGLDASEVDALVREAIVATGASSPRDMGKVMGWLSPKTRGRADGRLVSELVTRALADAATG